MAVTSTLPGLTAICDACRADDLDLCSNRDICCAGFQHCDDQVLWHPFPPTAMPLAGTCTSYPLQSVSMPFLQLNTALAAAPAIRLQLPVTPTCMQRQARAEPSFVWGQMLVHIHLLCVTITNLPESFTSAGMAPLCLTTSQLYRLEVKTRVVLLGQTASCCRVHPPRMGRDASPSASVTLLQA
jgi:hypothetical protein